MNVVTSLALGLQTLAASVCFARAIRRGTVIDRAIALDGVVSAIICGTAVASVAVGNGTLADIALVGGLLGFLTLSTVARYVGRRVVNAVLDVVAAILMLAGATIAVIAAVGLHTMPDLYARMHVATKPATLGITLCLSGAALRADSAPTATKLVLAIVFQLITTPAAGHLLGRAAHAARAPVSEHTVVDELRPLPERPGALTASTDTTQRLDGEEP